MRGSTVTDPAPVEGDAEADTVAFAAWLLGTIAEDPLLRPSYRRAARKHLARLRAGAARQLSADDFREARA
jgi:hypothetical protein